MFANLVNDLTRQRIPRIEHCQDDQQYIVFLVPSFGVLFVRDAAGARLGRQERVVGGDRIPHRAEAVGGNDVAGEGRARQVAGGETPGGRVRVVELVGVGAEIAGQHFGRGSRIAARIGRAVDVVRSADLEERLVLAVVEFGDIRPAR